MGEIVSKFGGSSVAEARQIRKIESIIRSDRRRRFIVVSAPGKRTSGDEKITDLLYSCQSLAARGDSYEQPFRHVSDRYLQIDRELEARSEIQEWLEEVRRSLGSGASADLAASRGEYLCARLLASYLQATFVDAAEVIRFGKDGSVTEESFQLIAERLAGPGLYVIPGFYGSDSVGQIRTFSRGGSDVTGALVARAVHAEVYENWTDVSGLLMADPQIVRDPQPMAEVTYREIRELSYMGAKVLHEEAILPVYKEKIPINIRNTNRPDDAGTIIKAARKLQQRAVAGVAGRNGFALLYLEKFLLRKDPQTRSKLFEILTAQGIEWEWERAGLDSLAVILPETQLEDKRELLVGLIAEALKPDHLEILDNVSLVAIVGEGISDHPELLADLLLLLSSGGVRVRLVEQGSSKISAFFVVPSKDFNRAVDTIYKAITLQRGSRQLLEPLLGK
ncbi:MAG: aspartate kinase [Spirochaetaceae bacterium]|nr:MAG: aspartate kinase [Spirochaetaceae bacterium]